MNRLNKKVELLSPAGNYEGFLGAIQAGADAVYLGGSRFGARAYADNFSQDEILKAIRYAHLFGRKVYLTVNTLFKQEELDMLFEYLLPFYEGGLDAVIIQDMGAFTMIGECFPGLDRHISTQMTVTGAYGASYLSQRGATRIVPARELSLEELTAIKQTVPVEIEIFIHGAMCYCYSGQCLFSSLLGGRSGNRGRCAQPCRLPYQKQDFYPLSLKDMCTVSLLPQLIEAGIDSFKIEGRMKSPAYTAGVTAVYRTYIDQYYETGGQGFFVRSEDEALLKELYLRSSISQGYYHKHNGADMITANSPGYRGQNKKALSAVTEKYLGKTLKLTILGEVVLKKDMLAFLTIAGRGISAEVTGNIVTEAKSQPLTKAQVEKQMRKSGNAVFTFQTLTIKMDDDIFLPVSTLNQLRRDAFFALEEGLLKDVRKNRKAKIQSRKTLKSHGNQEPMQLHAAVSTITQLEAVLLCNAERVYVPADLWATDKEAIMKQYQEYRGNTKWYVLLPPILRNRSACYLKNIEQFFQTLTPDGVMVQNLEELQWLRTISFQGDVVAQERLYMWNESALEAFGELCGELYLPLELNRHELSALTKNYAHHYSIMLYGRIPMMVSANCIAKTQGECGKFKSTFKMMTDRYHKNFPVALNCLHCYNVIYNTVPLSLHKELSKVKQLPLYAGRLDFTTETAGEVSQLFMYYKKAMIDIGENDMPFPYKNYTKGHWMRGVE